MSPVETMIEDARKLSETVKKMSADLRGLQDQIAVECCPYGNGDVVYTGEGLGLYGLVIQAVDAPAEPQAGNRWRLNTFARTKAGGLSRRPVYLEDKDKHMITRHEKCPASI